MTGLDLALACAEAADETGLRTDTNPNYDGIGEFLAGDQADIVTVPLEAGTLNVFRGKNTLHRVSPVAGDKGRVISVFSYYEKPGVKFSADEQIGFYGRSLWTLSFMTNARKPEQLSLRNRLICQQVLVTTVG